MQSAGQDAVVSQIAECLRGPEGAASFASVAACLARVLDVPVAFVAERVDVGTARLLAFSGPVERRPPRQWALAGTACAEVLEKGVLLRRAEAAGSFPEDPCLRAAGASGFAGRVLRDAAHAPVGLVGVASAGPLEWTPEADAALSILALAAELQLQRMCSERKLSRVARQWTATVDAMPDFVAVVGPDFRLLRVNLALANFANCSPRDLVGRRCHEVMHGLDHPLEGCPHEQALRTGGSVSREVNDPHVGRPLSVICTPFHDDDGKLVGTVHVARDISEQLRAARLREDLIGELQQTLAKVKVLSGLLPICAACKKIRNDAGYWEQVEVYVRDRTDATFSHGLCPECARELYPDYVR